MTLSRERQANTLMPDETTGRFWVLLPPWAKVPRRRTLVQQKTPTLGRRNDKNNVTYNFGIEA